MSEDGSENRHPAELGSVLRAIQKEHEEANVAQAGFHPDFVRDLISVVRDCFENWDESQESFSEKGVEDYLEGDRQEALDRLEKILEDFREEDAKGGAE